MPVTEHVTWTASCDECDWFEDGYEAPEFAREDLDEHIGENH